MGLKIVTIHLSDDETDSIEALSYVDRMSRKKLCETAVREFIARNMGKIEKVNQGRDQPKQEEGQSFL